MLIRGTKKEVSTLAWPLAIGMLSFTVMGVTDTLLMGHVGTNVQAGVGLATTLAFTFMAFFRGLTAGAQSLISAADGADDWVRIRRAAGAALGVGLLSGVLAAFGLLMATEYVLPGLVGNADITTPAGNYLRVRAYGLPLTLLAFALMSALQGLGDTKIRMWASIAGNVVNIGLDLVLIFGLGPIPAMGETGAAIATVAGQAVMLVMYAVRFRRVVVRPQWPTREVVRSALAIGLPGGTQAMMGTMAFMAMTVLLARVGAVHLAATEIALNIISLSFLPGYALGESGGVLVGRYLGAGDRESASRSVASARTLALWIMGVCGLLFMGLGEDLARLFNPQVEVAMLTANLLILAALFQLFDAAVMVHLCALRNAGDTRFTLLVTSVASWGVMLPTTYVLAVMFGFGAPGAWIGMTFEIMLLALVTYWRVLGLRTGRVGRLDLLLGERAPS